MKTSHPLIDERRLIVLRPFRIVGLLATIALLLILASIGGQLFKFSTGHDTVYGLIKLFDVDRENNIPTYFSASLLLLAAALLAVIATLQKKLGHPDTWQWAILAALFLYLAMDETASIHELWIRPVRELIGPLASGIFFFAWVIPGMVAVLILGLCFLKFLLRLPLRTRLLVVCAATLYVGGAIGFELVGGYYVELHGRDLSYNMIATVEESLEMAGIVVFNYALLKYIEKHLREVRFRFEDF